MIRFITTFKFILFTRVLDERLGSEERPGRRFCCDAGTTSAIPLSGPDLDVRDLKSFLLHLDVIF